MANSLAMGIRIKTARKICHKTQQQLANELGLATGTIQQYELGKREPGSKTLKLLAKALGVSVGYFYGEGTGVYVGGDIIMSTDSTVDIYKRELRFDEFAYAMMKETKTLTETDKQLLLSLAKQLNKAREKKIHC